MKHIVKNTVQFGIAVRSLRNEQNLTQNDIFNKVGLLQKTVSSIESGNAGTTIDSIFKLLNALDCDLVLIPRKNNRVEGEW